MKQLGSRLYTCSRHLLRVCQYHIPHRTQGSSTINIHGRQRQPTQHSSDPSPSAIRRPLSSWRRTQCSQEAHTTTPKLGAFHYAAQVWSDTVAVCEQVPHLIRQLRECDGDPKVRDRSGITALYYLLSREERRLSQAMCESMFRAMIDAGADLEARDRKGRTVFFKDADRESAHARLDEVTSMAPLIKPRWKSTNEDEIYLRNHYTLDYASYFSLTSTGG